MLAYGNKKGQGIKIVPAASGGETFFDAIDVAEGYIKNKDESTVYV